MVVLCDILEKERGIYKDSETSPDIDSPKENENEQQINSPSNLDLLEIRRFQGIKSFLEIRCSFVNRFSWATFDILFGKYL